MKAEEETQKQLSLTIVIPCFNEEKTVVDLLRRVRSAPLGEIEIIVVDDGSTDHTVEVLQTEGAGLYDILVVHEKNQGKGSALRTGFARATKDLVIVQDADLEYDPKDIPSLVAPIEQGLADVVYGSRFIGGNQRRVLFFWHSVGNKILTLLSNMSTNLNLTDMETCYKLFRREIIQNLELREKRFGFEPEVTARLAAGRLRIYEVGISYSGRTYEEGKKIGWKDAVRAVYCIVKYGFLPQGRN